MPADESSDMVDIIMKRKLAKKGQEKGGRRAGEEGK
jgi:hypothetical protein